MTAYFTEMFGPALGPMIGLTVIIILLALGLWILILVIRRFRSGLFVSGGGRGQAPRLAVIDAVQVDTHRRLVLVRRDSVEHLIMIGGQTDIVVEAGIGKPQSVSQFPQMPAQAIQQQPAAPQRTANLAARDAVIDAERGRPVRSTEALLPERRTEAAYTPPATVPAPSTPPIQVQSPQSQVAPAVVPAVPPVPTAPVAQQRSVSELELDKLLDELRPNPLRDR